MWGFCVVYREDVVALRRTEYNPQFNSPFNSQLKINEKEAIDAHGGHGGLCGGERVAAGQQGNKITEIFDNKTLIGGQIAYYYNTIVGPWAPHSATATTPRRCTSSSTSASNSKSDSILEKNKQGRISSPALCVFGVSQRGPRGSSRR